MTVRGIFSRGPAHFPGFRQKNCTSADIPFPLAEACPRQAGGTPDVRASVMRVYLIPPCFKSQQHSIFFLSVPDSRDFSGSASPENGKFPDIRSTRTERLRVRNTDGRSVPRHVSPNPPDSRRPSGTQADALSAAYGTRLEKYTIFSRKFRQNFGKKEWIFTASGLVFFRRIWYHEKNFSESGGSIWTIPAFLSFSWVWEQCFSG